MIPNLRIVILNMDLREDTITLIDSLLLAGAKPAQMILVDNGSRDGSVSTVQTKFGDSIQIIANQENYGFAQGNNQGFEAAFSQGADWVLLLNNDTWVAPDFFESLEQALTEDSPFKIFTPIIFYDSDPKVVWHVGSKKIPGTVLGWNLARGEIEPANLPPLLEVDFISGCAMLIHREVYGEVGLFDPNFFAYWEEVDFCSRARKNGFRMAVATRAQMWHKVSKTANREAERMRYLYMRNMIFYTRKHARGAGWILMAPYLLFRFIKDLVKDLLRGNNTFRIYRNAWKDGWGMKIGSSSRISTV